MLQPSITPTARICQGFHVYMCAYTDVYTCICIYHHSYVV